MNWAKGSCTKGDKCPFTHRPGVKGMAPTNSTQTPSGKPRAAAHVAVGTAMVGTPSEQEVQPEWTEAQWQAYIQEGADIDKWNAEKWYYDSITNPWSCDTEWNEVGWEDAGATPDDYDGTVE